MKKETWTWGNGHIDTERSRETNEFVPTYVVMEISTVRLQ